MTTKLTIRYWFCEIVAALFVLLFLYTAIIKLQLIDIFIFTIQYNPILKPYAYVVGWLVPITELLISLALIIPITRRAAVVSATLLMVIFTAYVGYMLATFSSLPCSCGGIIETMSWKDHLFFNSSFDILGLLAIFLHPNSLFATNRNSRTPVEKSRHQLKNSILFYEKDVFSDDRRHAGHRP